ncbi:hypothetical protein KKB18_10260, partial [bacterium]|nr:hypothetical protein [bacterium]
IYLLIIIWKYSGREIRLLKERDFYLLKNHAKYFFKYLLLFIVVSILVINIGFVFDKTLTPLDEYKFRSDLFKTLQAIPILRAIPIPLPYPYVDGMDWVKELDETGGANGNLYLLGKLQTHGKDYKGFKGYFFYAFLFKEPIAIQIFILTSIVTYLLNFRKNCFMEDELFYFVQSFFLQYISISSSRHR